MGTVLRFRASGRKDPERASPENAAACEIVIFPGVRIERHEFDLAHRLRDSAGHSDFDGIGGGNRPRKTS